MKIVLLTLILLASSFALSQQITCAKYDEQQGYKLPESTMRGCRSFNELLAAGGIKISKGKGVKSYSCFSTTSPGEAEDLFIFISFMGVISISGDSEHNGAASMQTFLGGVKANDGFTDMTWTQYPKESPFLWSEGIWVGHGDAEMSQWSDEKKALVPQPKSNWKLLRVPRLHASVEDDTVTLRLDINNAKETVETLKFNRRTGRALLDGEDKERSLRCIVIDE